MTQHTRTCPTCAKPVTIVEVDRQPRETTWDDPHNVPRWRTFEPEPTATVRFSCGHRLSGTNVTDFAGWLDRATATCGPAEDVPLGERVIAFIEQQGFTLTDWQKTVARTWFDTGARDAFGPHHPPAQLVGPYDGIELTPAARTWLDGLPNATLTVHIQRYWTPITVEVIEDASPEFAARFAAHRGPGHQLALLHAGMFVDAVAWRCATCNTGGDL